MLVVLSCLAITFSFHVLFLTLYRAFNKNDDAADAAVGMVHAVITVLISMYSITVFDPLHSPESYDYYTQPYPHSSIAFRVSLGYFVWHTLQFVFPRGAQYNLDMLIHSALCVCTYAIVVFTEWMHRPAMIALFFEFSTLWLHSVDILRHFKADTLRAHFKFVLLLGTISLRNSAFEKY